jgi:hypothetical protein
MCAGDQIIFAKSQADACVRSFHAEARVDGPFDLTAFEEIHGRRFELVDALHTAQNLELQLL